MSEKRHITDSRQILKQMSRSAQYKGSGTSIVASPGAGACVWAAKIVSCSSYNVYNLVTVVIGQAGSAPVETGQAREAVNLAEPFDQQGTLSAGTYVVMFRTGDKNVFYVEP